MIRGKTTPFTRHTVSRADDEHERIVHARHSPSLRRNYANPVSDFSENWAGHSPGNIYGRSGMYGRLRRICALHVSRVFREMPDR